MYGLDTPEPTAVARKDHAARRLGVHPADVSLDGGDATSPRRPVCRVTTDVARDGDAVAVTGARHLDLTAIADWWDRWFDLGRWPTEDLYYGLMSQFLGRVTLDDPQALAATRGRPVLFLANHQTMLESLWASIVVSTFVDRPTVTIAKAEHRETWLGQLIAHAFAWPGCRDPEVITFFDRSDKSSLPGLLERLTPELVAGERAVLVHVEGTRALAARHRTVKLSGAFVDWALGTGSVIVPMRYSGGLPVEPLEVRTDFPVGEGRQDLHVGAPLLPEDLAALPYKERKARITDAIDGCGPEALSDEVPLPGDPDLTAAVDAWVEQTGTDRAHAVILEVLRRREGVTDPIRRLLDGAAGAGLALADTPEDRWLGELARRLYGPKGPAVREG